MCCRPALWRSHETRYPQSGPTVSLQFTQGMDAPILLAFTGFILLAGDTVRGQFRTSLLSEPPLAEIGVDNVTAVVDITAQTVLVTIPASVNKLWKPTTQVFTLSTTLLIVGADGAHRQAVPIPTEWQASYTRGPSA